MKDKMKKDFVIQGNLLEEELKKLIDQKEKMINVVTQLQQNLKICDTNLRRAMENHNRIQAQIEILQKILEDNNQSITGSVNGN